MPPTVLCTVGRQATAQWAIAGDKLSLKWSKQTTKRAASGKWQEEECNKRGQGGCLQPGNEATC